MKRDSYAYEVLWALLLSVAGALLAPLLAVVLPGLVLQLLILALGFACLLDILLHSPSRCGRPSALLAWLLAATLLFVWSPPLLLYGLLHLLMLWLARAVFVHRGSAAPLIDLGLTLAAAPLAAWALQRSDSLFLALWCCFLLLATQRLMPPSRDRHSRGYRPDPFELAYQAALTAFARLDERH